METIHMYPSECEFAINDKMSWMVNIALQGHNELKIITCKSKLKVYRQLLSLNVIYSEVYVMQDKLIKTKEIKKCKHNLLLFNLL